MNSASEMEYINRMVAPGQPRPEVVWGSNGSGGRGGGVIQIHVTRGCDLACFHCTQGSNLAGKPVIMSPEEFRMACESLQGYWGVVGMFGGNPAVHPQFEELCNIMSDYFPKYQRGLWCNHPRGKGSIMRRTFSPHVSNLNVHGSQEAYNEFKQDWPECQPFGITTDSSHSPPFVAMQDVEPDERKRWELIANCDINRLWSAMVCTVPGRGLRAFFCEVAGAQAMLHANDPTWPDTGLDPTRLYDYYHGHDKAFHRECGMLVADPVRIASYRWWQLPMEMYADQVRFHCHRCGIPLRRQGQLAQGGTHEEVSQTHRDIYRPKVRDREVQLVTLDEGQHVARVTDYIRNATPNS